ncbi:hypothetical protein GCM10027418_09000 [Mariniluteicoccus endophyticus]
MVITPDLLLKIGALARTHTGLPKRSVHAPSLGEGADGDPLPVVSIARIRSRAVNPERETPSTDFLNSFILDDLGAAVAAAEQRALPPVLTAYAAAALGTTAGHRIDTVTTPERTYPVVGPAAIPYGRWPNNPDHGLATSQQLAVDLALSDVGGPPSLRSVNGPPGTGKTTLLRDVLAGLVVERARRIASLPTPSAAFTHKLSWKSGPLSRTIHVLTPSLTGFEMIVASSNNKAVENVSDELPDVATVKDPWAEADYLREVATQVRRTIKDDDSAEAWGMIAARLGNKANRSRFADAFWTNKREWASEPPSFRHVLEEADTQSLTLTHWKEATRTFTETLARVDRLRADAQAAEARLVRQQEITAQLEDVDRRLAGVEESLHPLRLSQRAARQRREAATHELERATAALAEHSRRRPGWWSVLVTLGASRREWEQALTPLRTHHRAAEAASAKVASDDDLFTQQIDRTEREVATLMRRRADIASERQGLLRACHLDKRRWGDAYPDDSWWHDVRRRELTTPWTERALSTARSEAFLAALELHRQLFRHTARRLIPSMRGAMDVVRGAVPSQLDPAIARAAWQVFFLVVPLVSTTFASLGRMFSSLGPNDLGWLFIDEAGQATPQSAVGGLFRVQHALVVGDPLQLTPIVTLPPRAEANIAREHGVPRVSLPSTTSAQEVADAANPWGTHLGTGDARLWVGTPLRVHRRCEDPMFTISNEVAYGGLMVHALPPGSRSASNLPPSHWLHVPAKGGSGHALADDIAVARDLVRQLLDGAAAPDAAPVPPDEIIVISPFRAMANAVARFPAELGAPVRAGTVHTAQGQEADVVVLVLGGDPSRPGARSWAAEKPNLVNVAASRAKKRLDVVGDHTAWGDLPHFRTISAYLPRSVPARSGTNSATP